MSDLPGGECGARDSEHGERVAHLSEIDMARRIAAYRPSANPAAWPLVEPYVKHVSTVAAASKVVKLRPDQILKVVSDLVLFCHGEGAEIVDEVVFDLATIERYVRVGCEGLADGTRANSRSWLYAIRQAVLGPVLAPPRPAPLSKSKPVPPYTTDELKHLRSWQRGLPTELMRHNTLVLLAGSAGAGLDTPDYYAVRGTDVVRADDGCVEVRVGGSRPRVTVCRREWERQLVSVAEAAGAGHLFRLHEGRFTRHTIANFVERLGPHLHGAPRLSTYRLRASWIVDHLNGGTPLDALRVAAGTKTLQALLRYEHWVDPTEPGRGRAALRGTSR
jgi:hypothetical protein